MGVLGVDPRWKLCCGEICLHGASARLPECKWVFMLFYESTYRGHGSLSLESSSHSVVDTFWFPPVCVDAFVGVALVAVEALCACCFAYHSVRCVFVMIQETRDAVVVELVAFEGGSDIRFFTIGMCFFAATIWGVYRQQIMPWKFL